MTQLYLIEPEWGTGDPRDRWRTPRPLFDRLHKEFRFDVDAAADESNHLLSAWWGPGGYHVNGLSMLTTDKIVWCNPPFSEIGKWAKMLSRLQATAVMLIPGNRTGRKWWREWVIGKAAEVRCIEGRVQYIPAPGVEASSCAFDSVLVIYRPDHTGPTVLRSY